jgi:hypothetical protein
MNATQRQARTRTLKTRALAHQTRQWAAEDARTAREDRQAALHAAYVAEMRQPITEEG